jgi:hypothetical protein
MVTMVHVLTGSSLCLFIYIITVPPLLDQGNGLYRLQGGG